MISIITASFNATATLRDNLACIRQQSEECRGEGFRVEHLLIDGRSTDGTLDIINAYCCADSVQYESYLLRRFISEPDLGIYDAMNKGITLAQGEIVGILNADDFYATPGVLLKVKKTFEDPLVDACYGDLCYVRQDERCRDQGEDAFTIVRYWKSGVYHPQRFYWGWMPPHPTFFVRRSVYEKHGLFNLALGSAADYEIMLRFLLRHGIKVVYIPEVLVNMRVGGVSNASVGNRLRANRNDRKAWDVNGLKVYPWTLFLKPIRKIPQWWCRPRVIDSRPQ